MIEPDAYDKLSRQEQLDAYLDDRLTSSTRQKFELQLQDDPHLASELELQREIDASLKRQFTAPTAPDNLRTLATAELSVTPVAAGAQMSVRGSRPQNRRLALAALAACIGWALAGWMLWGGRPDGGYERLALHEIYQNSVSKGFEPDWLCEDDREFAETFQQRQGQPLLLGDIAGGQMLGLAYLRGLTNRTTSMLARVEGAPVIVFVDRLDRDTRPDKPPRSSELNLFRKELAGLVLYEVTPLGEPRVLDAFHPIDELPTATAD